MKHFTTIEVPAHTQEKLDHTACDWCHEVIPDTYSSSYFHYGEFADIRIESVCGERFPDGSSEYQRLQFDLCPDCWNNKLLPYLKSQGVEPTVVSESI